MSNSVYKNGEIQSIIKLAQKGDSKALETLIKRIQKDIYSIFYHLTYKKEDVSDLTQEVLLKMAKNLCSLRNTEKFKPWLNKIIANTFSDYTRKNRNTFAETDEQKLNEIKDRLGCEPGERCLFTEIEQLIKSALLTLPQTLRLSLILREYEGLSYDDISKITNTTLGTVKSRIARARIRLQKELKEFI